jgi:hypothetical protein
MAPSITYLLYSRPAFECIIQKPSFIVPPQGAEIQGPLQPFASGQEYLISCKVWGSNPPARVEWFRAINLTNGLQPIKPINQVRKCWLSFLFYIYKTISIKTVTEDGNVTISFIGITPKANHHDNILICRGSNDELTRSANSKIVEDHHKMEIHCE